MNFERALAAMRKRERVKRQKSDHFYYYDKENEVIYEQHCDTHCRKFNTTFLVSDILADDWIIIADKPTLYNIKDYESQDNYKELAEAYQKGYYDGLGTGLNNGVQAGYKSVKDIENYFMSLLEKDKAN